MIMEQVVLDNCHYSTLSKRKSSTKVNPNHFKRCTFPKKAERTKKCKLKSSNTVAAALFAYEDPEWLFEENAVFDNCKSLKKKRAKGI